MKKQGEKKRNIQEKIIKGKKFLAFRKKEKEKIRQKNPNFFLIFKETKKKRKQVIKKETKTRILLLQLTITWKKIFKKKKGKKNKLLLLEFKKQK